MAAIETVTQANLVQGGAEGHPALHEQDGIYTVTDGNGNIQFEGDEVAAEFTYWRTVLGVPDEQLFFYN
jgi:hypothetical protein